jgi:hypothetical protein
MRSLVLEKGRPSVNEQHGSRYRLGGVRAQESSGLGDLRRRLKLPKRDTSGSTTSKFGIHLQLALCHAGIHYARRDYIHADAIGPSSSPMHRASIRTPAFEVQYAPPHGPGTSCAHDPVIKMAPRRPC